MMEPRSDTMRSCGGMFLHPHTTATFVFLFCVRNTNLSTSTSTRQTVSANVHLFDCKELHGLARELHLLPHLHILERELSVGTLGRIYTLYSGALQILYVMSHFGLSKTHLVTSHLTRAFRCHKTGYFCNFASLQFQQILTLYNQFTER